MAAFPSIEPLERSYDLGSHPVLPATFANGDETRFLHGVVAFGVPIALAFRGLTTSQLQLIRDHYAGQSTFRPFTIPAHLWRTHTSRYDVVPEGFAYRYASPPQETPAGGGLTDVAVSLLAVS